MIKFHWGDGITIVFIFFIGFLVTALIKSRSVDHSLVADDYYAKDIAYQEHFDKVSNVSKYGKEVKVNYENDQKSLSVNISGVSAKEGTITFYRPSNQKSDIIKKFKIKENNQTLQMEGLELAVGRWKVQLEWEENLVSFFVEKDIYVATP